MQKLINLITVMALLLAMATSQQVCLQEECAAQLKACDQACQNKLAGCTFQCTLGSEGCMQDCLTGSKPAIDLLYCSFDKCINLWSLFIYFTLFTFLSSSYSYSIQYQIPLDQVYVKDSNSLKKDYFWTITLDFAFLIRLFVKKHKFSQK